MFQIYEAAFQPRAAAVNWVAGLRCQWQMKQAESRKKQGVTRVRMQSVTTMFLTEIFYMLAAFDKALISLTQ